ncbi:MAG: DNA primase [Bacteroidales bacterium]|nr:DNA primase [Bacteroidales bacterium]
MIDQETIQRIMDAARIEEVIGDFVSLKKRGANHIGCCPFHNEKTPSFYVSPSKGIFKCFGCGEAGDVVKFLMKHEHYTYPEALRWLADKYHIEIKEEEQTEEEKQRQTERDGLFHVSEFAQKYFADLLYNDEMGRAVGLSYFHGRGLSDEVIKRFGLGYCLDEWSNFTDHALKNGYSLQVLEKTGLTIVKEDTGKQYDRFRGRVMFPIYSISGRVLGFSGRVLTSEKQAAKYVNSPDSDIYNKSRILYGLYQARSAIAKADKCYLVEGNVDVISMHQSGVENTVASCGTSLTVEQIRLIKRYTQNVTVLYDGDKAGVKAALRAIDLLFAEGMHVRLVLFPDDEDPDSYAQKYGSTQLQEFLASHEDNFIMYKTRVLLDGVKDDPIRKAELVSETARSIALVADLLERSEYIRQCSQMLRVSEEALGTAVARAIGSARQKVAEDSGERKVESGERKVESGEQGADGAGQKLTTDHSPRTTDTAPPEVERHLVRLLLNYGNEALSQDFTDENGTQQTSTYTVAQIIVGELEGEKLSFSHPLCQRVLEQCSLMVEMAGRVEVSRFVDSADDALRTFCATVMMDTYSICEESWKKKNIYPPKEEDNLLQDVRDSLNTFKSLRLAQMIAERRERLMGASDEEQMQLLAEIKQYTDLSRQIGSALGMVIARRLD